MENDIKDTIVFDKHIIKNFFKEYIEDSRNSIEKKNTRNALFSIIN